MSRSKSATDVPVREKICAQIAEERELLFAKRAVAAANRNVGIVGDKDRYSSMELRHSGVGDAPVRELPSVRSAPDGGGKIAPAVKMG